MQLRKQTEQCEAVVLCPAHEPEARWRGNLEGRTAAKQRRSRESYRTYEDELEPLMLDWNQHWFLMASKPPNLMMAITCKEKQALPSPAKIHLAQELEKLVKSHQKPQELWPGCCLNQMGGLQIHNDKQKLQEHVALCTALPREKRLWLLQPDFTFQISHTTSCSGTPNSERCKEENSGKHVSCLSEHNTNHFHFNAYKTVHEVDILYSWQHNVQLLNIWENRYLILFT